ncbi:PINIT domain-containing protein [Annulohypoxylon maeteangense]|uniref:PINIT domain-containing protein n=1 Tax=Annulohypoxylon maeteangense TaxID=1927788 RepID=UPI002008B2F6|nr:PINIT domain-containing protein [Annulohypoxylon maeteangense]KAI0887413.1 PINIT domain-containing protein [Annulohypoxylon maeteangense]
MSSSNPDIRSLERIISNMLNKKLQQICSSHGLKTGGVKADLQNRIKDALHENFTSDPTNFGKIRDTILSVQNGSGRSSMAPPLGSGSGSQLPAQSNRSNYASYGYNPYPQTGSGVSQQGSVYNGHRDTVLGYGRVPPSDNLFKNTPFYTIEMRVSSLQTCQIMSNHRNSVNIVLRSNDYPELARCGPYPSPMRVMVFCGSENTGPQEIQFPHQAELKVNGEDIKHNLRGLKNKPGSTHPVDITQHLRLKPSTYTNNIEFTYALTSKKFYLALYLCKTHSIDELVAKIKTKKISKASVIREISKKANDPDIVTTSQVLSLLCPLTYMRLKTPCRGMSCNHIQCFDANSFMQLQEQGPTWSCPICYKAVPFETLAIDDYVDEVLSTTPDSLQQVTIEPDGQWKTKTEEPEPSRFRPAVSSKIEDDDDISIISDSHGFPNGTSTSTANGRNNYSTPSRSFAHSGTPSGGARDTSTAPRSSHKRPAEVIDLTLSSDEDDEPIARAPKRQNQGTTLNGLSYPSSYNPY